MPYNTKAVPQFEALRQRQQNRQQAQVGTADDALKRRFASMGAMNSGAMVKAQQNMLDNSARQNEEATQGIDFAEAQESSRQEERGQDVGFRGEQFQFQKDEAGANRKMQESQFDRNYALQEAQMNMDSQAQNFNMGMAKDAQKQAGKGIVGSILGGGGVLGTVGEVFGGGGKFFCTELYNRGLCSAREMLKMCEFFFRCMWSDTSTCFFYASNAEYIVSVANKHEFDWSQIKTKLIDDVIKNMENGNIQISKQLYKEQIRDMCLRFEGTQNLWNFDSFKTTWIDRITKLPRLMLTKTFWRACKITYVASKVRRELAWQS